jgi:hypothetical protein
MGKVRKKTRDGVTASRRSCAMQELKYFIGIVNALSSVYRCNTYICSFPTYIRAFYVWPFLPKKFFTVHEAYTCVISQQCGSGAIWLNALNTCKLNTRE